MYRPSDVMQMKSLVSVRLKESDGETLEGHVYLGGSERVLDLMNNGAPFMPLEIEDGKVLLLNKAAILHVEPYDHEWMASSEAPPAGSMHR